MGDTPLLYTDLTVVGKREKYDPDCTISLENFQSLVAEVKIRSELRCQFEIDGSRCNNIFNNGWLARRSDSREGLIGCECGNKHLLASEMFIRDRDRLHREQRMENHLEALNSLLANRDAVIERWRRVNQSLSAARATMRGAEDRLPSGVFKKLRDMAKRRNPTVYVEVQRVEIEKDEKGNDKRRVFWDRRDLGNLIGLEAWNPEPALDLFKTLDEIKDTISKARADGAEKESQLRKWRETLEQLPHCDNGVAQYARAVAAFLTRENYRLLCHLVDREDEKVQVAMAILGLRGGSLEVEAKARAFVGEAEAGVRQQYGEKKIRVG